MTIKDYTIHAEIQEKMHGVRTEVHLIRKKNTKKQVYKFFLIAVDDFKSPTKVTKFLSKFPKWESSLESEFDNEPDCWRNASLAFDELYDSIFPEAGVRRS